MYKEVYDLFKEVNSLVNLDPTGIYKTKNFDMFIHLMFNRGTKCGYDEVRVKALVKMYYSGEFYPELAIIDVNRNGINLEGNCRIEACRRVETYILFHICFDSRLNIENGLELVNHMQVVNSYKPAWRNGQQFETAILAKTPLAILLDELQAMMMANKKFKITTKSLTINQMMVLADIENLNTHSKCKNVGAYNNDKLYRYAKTRKYKKSLIYICEVITALVNSAIDTSKVIEQLMLIMRTYPEGLFNQEQFLSNVQKNGFKVSQVKNELIYAEIKRMGIDEVVAKSLSKMVKK